MSPCTLSVALSVAAFAAVLAGFAVGLPGPPLLAAGFAVWLLARAQAKRC
jgi:hypothetical protein